MSAHDFFDQANGVSDPSSADYDPRSPLYVVTADPSSRYYVGPVAPTIRSADEVRAEIAAQVDTDKDGWLGQCLTGLTRE